MCSAATRTASSGSPQAPHKDTRDVTTAAFARPPSSRNSRTAPSASARPRRSPAHKVMRELRVWLFDRMPKPRVISPCSRKAHSSSPTQSLGRTGSKETSFPATRPSLGSKNDNRRLSIKRSGSNFGEVLVTGPLAEVVGETRLPRTQVVKRVWEYIRKRDLQDPADKRKILVWKDRLLASFLTEPCTMFNMNKQISPYMTKVENPNKKPKKKQAKSDGIGLQELCGVSKALEGVIGARHMKRSAIVAKIWEYIREHNLQDPSDKRNILPDKTLGKVFTNTAEARLTMFSMNKQLSGHLIKLSDEIRAEIVGA